MISLYKLMILFLLGSKLERAQLSLTSMGPAIVNGGITTFLALLLLGFSQSHVFVTFFKVSLNDDSESHVFVAFFKVSIMITFLSHTFLSHFSK